MLEIGIFALIMISVGSISMMTIMCLWDSVERWENRKRYEVHSE